MIYISILHLFLMSTQEIISKLRQPHTQRQLKDAGMTHLRIFWSHAHGTATETSDVDLLYTFDPTLCKVWSRWPYGQYEYLRQYLGRDVDLVSKSYIDDRIREDVLSSTIPIY